MVLSDTIDDKMQVSPANELFQKVLTYLENHPHQLCEEDRWHKKNEILQLIQKYDVGRIIEDLFFRKKNRRETLDLSVFAAWGYIAAMANMPAEMEAIFRGQLQHPDSDGTAVLCAFEDAYHYDVIMNIIHNFQFEES